MAEALTYSSLVTDIALYVERDDADFLAQIPRFIMLAENKLASTIKGLGFSRTVNFNLQVNNAVYQKPVRWRETTSISILVNGQRSFLKSRSSEYVQTYWPDQSQTDVVKYYSDYDYEHWLVAPTPSSNLVATVGYYERPEPLSDANQTNWTTQYAPQLLLYASLLEAQPFLKTPERIQEFQMAYEQAAMAINKENVGRLTDSGSRRGVK
jgi:hypothetical protein